MPRLRPMTEATTAAMYVPTFFMRQKLTLMVNRYELVAATPDGREGEVLAFAQQKRMAFKEEVTFYTDSGKSRVVFRFKARKRLDLSSGYDVYDETGAPLGYMKKDFGRSLLRSSWHLSGPSVDAFGQERRPLLAIVRRVWDFIPVIGDVLVPFRFHFDFTDKATGRPVMSSERQTSIRDRYTITVPDQRLDFRLAAAMAVALDAFQSR